MQSRAKEAGVKSNAHTVQLAAEDFAVQNDGVYATDQTTVLPNNNTLATLLPANLKNPFSSAGVAVVDGPPTADGEVGYDSAGLVGIGYTIVGWGKDNTPVITLTNGS
jgi:hypothetical protein